MIDSLTGQGINAQQSCVALDVSPSGYYAWKDQPDAPRTLRRIWLAGEIADVHKASGGTYGALRVTAELRYGRAIHVGHNAVESIMREISDPRSTDPQVAARRQGVEDHLAGPGRARVPARSA